jgi:hypothetical protein
MAYTKTTWIDEVLVGAERFNIEDNVGADLHMNCQITLATGVTITGTSIDAANLNHIEGGIYDLSRGVALSVKGITGNATGDVADIAAGTDGYVLRRSGTTLAFGQVVAAGIADNAITSSKIEADAVINSKIAAGAVGTVEIDDNQIDSQHYIDGSIDYEHLSAGACKVTNRQGGSATDWSVEGNNNYVPISARIQAGAHHIASGTGNEVITFPIAFSYAPIIILGLAMKSGVAIYCYASAVTATNFTLAYNALVDIYPTWLAIGPA